MPRKRQQDDEFKQYVPLIGLIEPYIDGPFEKLPAPTRKHTQTLRWGTPLSARARHLPCQCGDYGADAPLWIPDSGLDRQVMRVSESGGGGSISAGR